MGHIYIGTIGMKGSYRAMRTGYVDEGWAKAHPKSPTKLSPSTV